MRNKKIVSVGGMMCMIALAVGLFSSNAKATSYLEGVPFDNYVTKDSVILTCDTSNGVSVLNVNNEAVKDTKTFTEEGEYTVEVLNKDGEQLDVVEFIIDKTAPVVKGVENGGIYKAGTDIEVEDLTSVTGTLNGKKLTDSDIEEGFECSDTGKYTLTLRDAAGNSSTTKFTIDGVKPKVTGVKNGKYYNKTKKIKFSDKGTGIEKATLNGKAVKSGKKVSKTGRYTLKVYDKAGNCTTTKFYLDKVKPKVTVKKKWGVATVRYSDNFGSHSVKSVTVDGIKQRYITRGFISVPQNGGTKIVVVTDKAGNKRKVKFK